MALNFVVTRTLRCFMPCTIDNAYRALVVFFFDVASFYKKISSYLFLLHYQWALGLLTYCKEVVVPKTKGMTVAALFVGKGLITFL